MIPKLMTVVLLGATLVGCSEAVPSGHVGRVRGISGFKGKPLAPGYHSCWGRDKLYLMEVTDRQFDIPMAVLCKDQLNFKFNIGVLVAVDKEKVDIINEAFENVVPASVGSGSTGGTITVDQLFEMYVKPVVDQEARRVVSRYATSEIAFKRDVVMQATQAAAENAIKQSLLKVKRITINNMDFPDVITLAQEARAKRQIEVETMKAETEKQVEKAKGQLKVANIEYQRRLVEASTIADSNKIIGASITPEYLAWHEIKVLGKAAMGPNNWGFIPYSNMSQKVIGGHKIQPKKLVLDQALLDKIKKAKEAQIDKPN